MPDGSRWVDGLPTWLERPPVKAQDEALYASTRYGASGALVCKVMVTADAEGWVTGVDPWGCPELLHEATRDALRAARIEPPGDTVSFDWFYFVKAR